MLAYQSTFTNTRTCCSPSQNFLHFTLQSGDFPDFWAIPFDTKFIFFTKEKMNSNICHYTLVGIPEYLHKHQDVLLSIAELPTFYIANLRFSRFLSHPFWYKIHFFIQKKRWIRTSVTIHLLAYQSTFTNTRTCCSPSQNFLRFTLQKCDFPDFWAIPFGAKVIFFTKEKMNSNIYHDTHVGIPEYLHKHQDVLLSIAELPTFYIAKLRFSRFLSHPFWYKIHFFHKRKDEFEHLSRYTCWHTRVPSQTPGRVALHRRTSYILHCKVAIFPIFEPSLLIQNSFFSQKKRWIRTSVTIHLLAYQSTFTNTRTSCSPSQNFLHFTLQICDFPDFWAIPFDTKFIFFTKEKMNSNICHDTLVGIQEYLHKHQDVLLSIAELPTFYIAKVRFSRFLSHPFWCKSHFFHKRKDEFEHLSRYPCWHTRVPSQTPGRVALHRRTSYILHCKVANFPIFEQSLLIQKSFFHKRKDEFQNLSRYTCWHTRVPSKTPGLLALHRRTSYILHCKVAIFPIFEPSLLIQNSFFSQKKRWIRTSVTIHLLAYQSTFTNTRTCCSPSQNFLRFTLQKCDFPDFWAIPFDTKVIFFTQRKMNSKICQDTLVGIQEYLQKHQDVLLSIAELPTFYIAKLRFSRFLSHPFWYKIHFFHKRKDEFEHLSRYTCWHTRVPSQTPGRVALHRRTSYILHCKVAIFPIFEPSLLIQNSFFSQKKRWIRTSVTIHLLAYQSTFTNTRTSCSPSQNFLHFTLQICDFPDFWAIPFDTKFIFFTKEKMNSNICHDTLVGIPEYLHKHQDVLLSIAELPTFYIAKVRFSRFLSHPFWCKSHFFHKRKDEFEHLSRYPCWHTRVPSQTPGRVALHRRTSYILHCKVANFPIFEQSLLIQKSFFHKRKDEFQNLSRYTCWHTRVPSKTPGLLALHRRTSYILHCKVAIFPIFEPSLLIQNSFFSQKKRWIRTSVTIHLLAYQSTFTNTRTCCSPSQNFLRFTLQKCDFPDFWAIPFDTKVIFFTQRKMNSKICQDTLVGIQEYLQKHQDVLLSIAELPTFYIAKLRFSRFLSNRFWYKSHFSTKEKMNSNICHDTLVGIPEYLHKHQDVLLSIAELPTFYIAKLRFSRFLSHPFWCKSHFFHKRKDVFEHLSRYPCWHTRVPSQTPGRVALHHRTSYILHCKVAIFPIFEQSLLVQKSFFSQKKRWIRTSVTIPMLAYQSTFTNTRTCCSPSQNFLHFTLQSCDFPDFWAIPFDTKFIFFTKEKMNSNICHDTLVGIPEYLHKHQDVLLSIAELPTFYIAKVRFSRFLSHPFWCKSHFFHKRKDEFEHLSRYPCWHTRVPSQTPGRVALHRRTSYVLHCKSAIFPIFEPSLLVQKSFFSQKKRWIRTSVTIPMLAYQSTFTNTRTGCSPSQNFLHFTLQRGDFHDFWAIPFDTKVIFFHTKKDEFENLSRYTCWYTRVPSKTPGRLALHRRTSYILHCKVAIFPIFDQSLLIQKSFFHKRKDEFQNLSRYTCWHTRVPSQTPGRLALHRRTSYILHCKVAIFPIFEPSLLIQNSIFSQKKRWIRTSVTIH